MGALPKRQRVAAYAVILRDDQILLSRLARSVTAEELWTLPGGGLDHGEDPRHAVVREVREETGLDAEVGETARVYSAHLPGVWREGRRVDAHALRIVYDAWVPPDAPEPHVVEVDGSTMEAAWKPVADVLEGRVPVVAMVLEALADHRPYRHQRLGAYALVLRPSRGSTTGGPLDTDVLLTRISERGYHTGSWSLPGGGVDHGEPPREAVIRELEEECGLRATVGDVLLVHDERISGAGPGGRFEDFHGVSRVYAAEVDAAAEPRLVETDGTTDAVAWVPVADVLAGRVPVLPVVREALPTPEPPPAY
jgi:ADP-ribose pyrophosphatase YjhB (NUDIX family)